ncbi:hypothetical protein BCR37DRAFT_391132 [Protomyces lactucae-debilis]|uniref:Uncharacterized protein n=1 Tax=Protomyces lactucae-debilis TaxID=2754530 RepID=A0A1Y2FQY8_PROLT|nr:uncharacterized protein BCR37DRAFT_391132 [Protomyces lactucae-debilis]ORY86349.1 hypothetical protein BCR37DRAFT_391132 [Protomyces lactucae-debilis]
MFHALQRINLSALVVLLVLVLATRSVNPFKGKNKAVSGGDAAGELMSRELEFILSTEFPVIDSEQCEKRCRDIMEKYKEARSEIKAGPYAHDRCNLGWMYFGWRFSLGNLPFDVRLFSDQTKALVGELQQMNGEAGIRPSEPSSVHGKGKEPMHSELVPRFENNTLSVYIDRLWDQIDRAVDWVRFKTPVPEPGNFPAIKPAIGHCSALLFASTASCSTASSSQANLLPLKYLLTAITAQFWRASDIGKARREEAHQAAEAERRKRAEEKKDGKRAGAKKGSKPAKEDPRMCTCDIGIVVEDAFVNEEDCDPLIDRFLKINLYGVHVALGKLHIPSTLQRFHHLLPSLSAKAKSNSCGPASSATLGSYNLPT